MKKPARSNPGTAAPENRPSQILVKMQPQTQDFVNLGPWVRARHAENNLTIETDKIIMDCRRKQAAGGCCPAS